MLCPFHGFSYLFCSLTRFPTGFTCLLTHHAFFVCLLNSLPSLFTCSAYSSCFCGVSSPFYPCYPCSSSFSPIFTACKPFLPLVLASFLCPWAVVIPRSRSFLLPTSPWFPESFALLSATPKSLLLLISFFCRPQPFYPWFTLLSATPKSLLPSLSFLPLASLFTPYFCLLLMPTNPWSSSFLALIQYIPPLCISSSSSRTATAHLFLPLPLHPRLTLPFISPLLPISSLFVTSVSTNRLFTPLVITLYLSRPHRLSLDYHASLKRLPSLSSIRRSLEHPAALLSIALLSRASRCSPEYLLLFCVSRRSLEHLGFPPRSCSNEAYRFFQYIACISPDVSNWHSLNVAKDNRQKLNKTRKLHKKTIKIPANSPKKDENQ